MRSLAVLLVLLSGCERPAADAAAEVRSEAAAVIAAAVKLAPAPVDATRYQVGPCPNCKDGRTGDGFATCRICRGDGQISAADLAALADGSANQGDRSAATPAAADPGADRGAALAGRAAAGETTEPPAPPEPAKPAKPDPPEPTPVWEPATIARYSELRAAADPVLIYFCGPNCGPCRVLERDTLAPIETDLRDLIGTLLRDDSAASSELARLFRVTSTPQVCVVYADQLARFSGDSLAGGPEAFYERVLRWLDRRGLPVPSFFHS